jgi:hypothetical protein
LAARGTGRMLGVFSVRTRKLRPRFGGAFLCHATMRTTGRMLTWLKVIFPGLAPASAPGLFSCGGVAEWLKAAVPNRQTPNGVSQVRILSPSAISTGRIVVAY